MLLRTMLAIGATLSMLGPAAIAVACDHARNAVIDAWSIQLQDIDPATIARSDADLVVIDYSADGSELHAFGQSDVAMMRCKADGTQRLLIAYLSLGEAEDYRYYWQPEWKIARPNWLAEENPNWPGNFRVKFWDADWQSIVFGSSSAYLDKIIAAGFDGVFLDVIDSYEYWEPEHAGAGEDMADLIARLAGYARSKTRCFAIVSQNAEGLLPHKPFLHATTFLSKESLFYGEVDDDRPNSPQRTAHSLKQLELARKGDIPILDLEYAGERTARRKLARLFERHGVIGAIGTRQLKELATSFPAANASVALSDERLCRP